jgi:hypothetical protein
VLVALAPAMPQGYVRRVVARCAARAGAWLGVGGA